MSNHISSTAARGRGHYSKFIPTLLLMGIVAGSLALLSIEPAILDPTTSHGGIDSATDSIAGSASIDDPVLGGGGYSTGNVARFDVVENVTSTLIKRDFQAVPSNYHNISIPAGWTNDSTQLGLQPYYKVQKVDDPAFTKPAGEAWTADTSANGIGTITQSFRPTDDAPLYAETYMKNILFSATAPGFRKNDYALWRQNENVMNTNGDAVIEGLLYQKRSQSLQNYGGFTTDPGFSTDLAAPYGGINRPDDSVVLTYDSTTRSLVVNMLPAISTVLGGNPSAAWWHTINIPYEADYVQMKVSWSIDAASTFEASDYYQVIARVNNEYIDGRPVASGGMMVAKDDSLPYNGSATNLMMYTNPAYLVHSRITRTYNVTSLVNGLTGLSKFDFGAWAHNPTHAGDPDRIIARFHYIEIGYNTSDKYEVARLDFDYQCTSNLTGNVGTTPASYLAVNRASLFLQLEQMDIGSVSNVRTLPFKNMTVYKTGTPSRPWIHVSTSIPQKYKDLLTMGNIRFSIGVIFEKDYYDLMSHLLLLDNVTFSINYAYPTVAGAQLQLSVDDGAWISMASVLYAVAMGGWTAGQDHTFKFQSLEPQYGGRTFVNFYSMFVAHQFVFVPNAAYATYSITSANDQNGTWSVKYNNTATYNALLALNATLKFAISQYSFSCLDLPAFDAKGSSSSNWLVAAASTPIGTNFTQYMARFNYTDDTSLQSVRLDQARAPGIWTITASQPNYITSVNYIDNTSYLGTPAYFKGTTLNYTFNLNENVSSGNYSVSLLNSSGAAIAGYPIRRTSSGQAISGSVPLPTSYAVGKYYLELRWNDTAAVPGTALRFGSSRSAFFVLNATVAMFKMTTPSVQSGTTANFTIFYETIEAIPITGATVLVFENSSGFYKLWGMSWMGSYQVGPISYPDPGNYSIPLYTTGAPSGIYNLIFAIGKLYHQPRNLTFALSITTTSQIVASITAGATWNGSAYNIDPGNVPYVNDTINSIIQVLVTQQGSGTPIQNGFVIGHIGTTGVYVIAIEVYSITHLAGDRGKYNLTLDTTGLNATSAGSTTKLFITCSASGYDPKNVNVTITIDKCPTQTSLNSVPNVNEGGSIALVATLVTRVNPAAPISYNYGTLTFYIYQGATAVKTGTLALLMNGVYTSMVSLVGLVPGNFTVRLNATAFNCQSSLSANVSFAIVPRLATNITLTVPDSVRILKPFQISATLAYLINGTAISGKTVTLNLVIGTDVNFVVTATTDALGTVTYDYIIDSRYFNKTFQVNTNFAGDVRLAPDSAATARTIFDRIPINMTLLESPLTLRTGYPATYTLQINITDLSESLLNRLIVFVAWYENQNITPFLTQQLRTDINGITSYTVPEIAGGFANLTIFFEYQGSATVAYNFTSLTQSILPRWISNFTVEPLPGIIRYGQTISFSLNFTCENTSISLVGLPVVLTFLYGINPSSTAYIQQGNTFQLVYTIPEGIGTSLNVSIAFAGTAQVAGRSQLLTLAISPKIQVILQFSNTISPSYMTGTYIFSVRVTDAGGSPLPGLTVLFEVAGQQQPVPVNTEGIASITIELTEVGNEVVLHVRFIEAGEYTGAVLDSPRFRVLNEWLYFLDLLPYIGIALGIVLAIAISIHRGVIVPRRKRARALLSRMYHRLSDVENVQYILVLSKGGGVPMFSKSLAEVPIDESLVSGFLSAISSFGAEISTKMKKDTRSGGLEELSYQQFKIILDEGQYVRVALLLLRRPSDTLKERLRAFTAEFEKRFQVQVANFKGEVLQDMVVTPVIEQAFESDLLYPHRLIEQKVVPYAKELPRKSVSKKVLAVARSDEFDSIFYIRELISNLKTKGIEEIHSFDAVQKLKADQVVFAINPRTNYIIEQLKPYIKMLTADDRATLFAIYENNTDGMAIQKFFNKNKIVLTTELADVLAKLKAMRVIEENNHINSTGAAIVTILRLIPDL